MAKSVKKAGTSPKAPEKTRQSAQKKAGAPKVSVIPVSHDQIAQLAHRFWSERGGGDGHHEEDWLRAEQQLRKKAS
jgi:hypothetical protein